MTRASVAALALAWTARAVAEPTPAEGITAAAGGGQPAIAVRVTGSAIAYRACAQTPRAGQGHRQPAGVK